MINKNENPFVSLTINIILPYLILTKGAKYLGEHGPYLALIIALILPIGYGLYDYITSKNTNYISIFGVLNTLFTGGFALFQLKGIWFVVKEAAFPFAIGLFVLYTTKTSKPLIKSLLCNEALMDVNTVNQVIEENGNTKKFKELIKSSNLLFAVSFFLSALLNFIVASLIFIGVDEGLSAAQHTQVLNEQIAKMTWMGYVVIALPLMFFMGYVMYRFTKHLKILTGLKLEEIFKTT